MISGLRAGLHPTLVGDGYLYFGAGLSLSAILTRSASDSAPIFSMTCPRWVFMVNSLVPSSAPICLLSSPEDNQLQHFLLTGVRES
jgi:hypothetical protein